MPTVEILSQGDEVVTGQIADTNAAWLAARLTELGFEVVRHTTVGDHLQAIAAELSAVAERADLCISTGGLGPTDDDLTTRAAEAAFGRPLHLDEQALRHIEALFARFGRPMAEVNRRQAWLPEGCLRLDNDRGTAPGFAIEHGQALLAFLPGVPREMKPMFEQRVLPLLRERFALAPARLITLRTTGIGESDLQQRVGSSPHPEVVLSFRTTLPENHLKLRVPPQVPDDEVRALVAELSRRIGSPLFGVEGLEGPGGSLVEVVGRALGQAGHTLAVAESCTGGQLAAACTGVPGASAWFLEGVVSYANEAKVRLLGVSPRVLADHGAVSGEVACQMAAGVRERSGATYGLGVTGIAGPGGGTPDKPVGTVHLALAAGGDVHHRRLRLPGDRARVQALTVGAALDLLRRKLQNLL